MTSKRSHAFIFIFSGIFSLPNHGPVIVNKNYSDEGIEYAENVTLDEWFLRGFECCNIVQTNHTESPGLQELNMVPDIIYSGNIEEIQDIMNNLNKNTELAIAHSVNPYITVAYTCTALLLFVVGVLIQKFRSHTLRLSLRDNSPTYQENEFSGNNIVNTYV